MATSFSTNALFLKPATADRNWDIPVNANIDSLDGMTAIGSLIVTATEIPSTSLNVRVSLGSYVKADGTIGTSNGISSYALPTSSTLCLWLTDAGILTASPAFPLSAHVRLAQVVTSTSTVTKILDQRIQCGTAGTGLGFVTKSGDVMWGPLTIAATGAGNSVFAVNVAPPTIGFFGSTPATQCPSTPVISDISTGIVSNTIADVGTTYSQSSIDNNFASLAAKVNAVIVALKRHGLMSS